MANKRISELTEYLTPAEGDYLAVVDTATHETKKIDFINFKGDKGDAATLDVGSTTTGAAGSDASVTNSGSTSAAIFDFVIPRGDTGATGPQGEKGDTGDIDHAGDITADGVFIDSDSENNSAQFSYGYGFNPLESEYYNKKFRIESFLESPFFSCGVARNYLLQTEAFGATWVNTGGTLSSNDATLLAPNGSATAENIVARAGNPTDNILQTIANSTKGYWSAGLWLRVLSGTGTVTLQIDSGGTGGGETGTPKTCNLDEKWRFFAVTQNLTADHSTKTFKITYGETSIQLWGARMNPGQSCNAYNARTTSGLTAATPGVFFNNTPVYATTFTGALTGNATSATSTPYSNYGSYLGNTISDASDNTDKWEYFGNVTISYQATYSYGSSYNVDLLLQEMSKDGSKTAAQLETARVVLKGSLASYAGNSATFNTNVPSMAIELYGENLVITKNDIACRVESTSTSAKVIRFYVKLKDNNTHYNITVLNSKGASYSSAGTISTAYCNFLALASQAVITDLPAAAQGDIVYATDSTTTLNSALVTTGNITSPTIKLTTGAGLGKVLTSDADGDATWGDAASGDMTLAGIQSVTGAKTFDKDKILMKGTSTGVTTISTANTSASNYTITMPAANATLLYSGGALGTPSSGTLTNCSGLPVSGITASTSTALGVGSIELGHASDTTLSRGAAGFLAVEGKRVPSPASQASGDILYRGGTEWERLAKGTAGQVLTMNSGATAPEWATATTSTDGTKTTFVAGETLVAGDSVSVGNAENHAGASATGTSGILAPIYGANWYAQSFVTSASAIKIPSVSIMIEKTGSPSGNLNVSLYEATGTAPNIVPTGSALGTVSVSASTIGSSSDVTFTFSSPVSVNASSKYAIVVSAPSASNTSNCIKWSGNNSSTYASGNFAESTNSGSSWGASDYDFRFSVNETWTIAGRVYKSTAVTNTELFKGFVGFATEAKNAGENILIQHTGVNANLTGLTPHSTYYLSDAAGTIGTSAGSQSKKIGMALTATQLLIIRDNV